MTPRGEAGDFTDRDGYESHRSDSIQLTGIKPKALHFVSPVKSPNFKSASTQDRTASGAHAKVFGLSNCLYKCEEGNGSPEVENFQGDSVKDIKMRKK